MIGRSDIVKGLKLSTFHKYSQLIAFAIIVLGEADQIDW